MNLISIKPLSDNSFYDYRSNGVVYTPIPVANVLLSKALNRLDSSKKITVLEPSCGDGSFLSALSQNTQFEIYALDKNKKAISHCELVFSKTKLFEGNYFGDLPSDWPSQFNLIIGNPPYVSWHHCDAETRISLSELSNKHEYLPRYLKNTWVGFIVKSTMKLFPNGVLAFVIPYEFLTIIYGKYLLKWMEKNFASIDIFVPDEKAFKSIDQDAVTIVAVKGTKKCRTTIHRVPSLASDQVKTSCIVVDEIEKSFSLGMKGFLLDSDTIELINNLKNKTKSISDFCDSAAGTVTAANEYFILTRNDVVSYKLEPWARPIIKKSSFINNSINFKDINFEEIVSTGKNCYLLDFSNINVNDMPKAVKKYVAIGEERGFHLRYKCRHRVDWFKVPIVANSEGFFFKRLHVLPRLCVNSCGVLTTDAAYHVRMKSDQNIHNLCASFYNSLTLLFTEIEGRFYGGGVLELTPTEFRSLPLPLSNFLESEFVELENKFTLFDKGRAAISFSNARLQKTLQLTPEQIILIENARQILQKHRLRHGKGS